VPINLIGDPITHSLNTPRESNFNPCLVWLGQISKPFHLAFCHSHNLIWMGSRNLPRAQKCIILFMEHTIFGSLYKISIFVGPRGEHYLSFGDIHFALLIYYLSEGRLGEQRKENSRPHLLLLKFPGSIVKLNESMKSIRDATFH